MSNTKIRKAGGTWVVRVAGMVIGETQNALALAENGYDDVIYFPRADIGMEFLDRSDTSTVCPHKGTASYFSLSSPEGNVADVAWSYEAPNDNVSEIAGHLAFYVDKVAVEEL